jgi:hypothetical protein
MSKEGPKAPLWPEGISKVRPVENHRAKALTAGVFTPVAKEPSLAEQKDRERSSSKPPPAESPVPDQKEVVPNDQRENKNPYVYPVHPSETDPDWKSYSKRKRKQLDDEWFFRTIVEGMQYDNKLSVQEIRERSKRMGKRIGS